MLSLRGWACVTRRAAVALGASAARGAGPGPQDRAEFLLLASPVKFFPAADPEAKILAGLQLRLIRGSTLLEAPSPSSFSKEFCSKSSSTCSSGGSSRSSRSSRSSSTCRSGISNRSSSGSRRRGSLVAQLAGHPRKRVLIGGFACHLLYKLWEFWPACDVGGGGGDRAPRRDLPAPIKAFSDEELFAGTSGASKHSVFNWLSDFACATYFRKSEGIPCIRLRLQNSRWEALCTWISFHRFFGVWWHAFI